MASSSRPSTSNAAPSNTIILQGNTLNGSTINMHQHVNQSTPREPPQSYGLPDLPTIVDKREADIKTLYALMTEHHKVVITGIGGLGKTTLANLCARKWVEDGTYQHVIFINVETDESASSVLKRLAERVLNSQAYSDSIIKEIYECYNKAKTLLILDNIEQNSILPRYYPSEDFKNIDILGTSQFTELKGCFHLYSLQKLSGRASVQLILDIFSSAKIEVPATVVPMITDLVVKLWFHPLALQHAAALIIDMCTYDDMSLEQSLNKYKEDFDIKLQEEFPADHLSRYRKSVFVAISLNIAKATIGKEHVKSLLHCMTYLDPSWINIAIFYKVFSTNDIQESFKLLKRYSLISVGRDIIIRMHRLIPIVCHAMLTADDKIKYLKSLLNIFFYNTDDGLGLPIGLQCSFFIEHFQVNFNINNLELAAYYKAEFYNNDQIKERLTARLQVIDCVISDTEGWSVEQCCVFAGHETFYRYFTGIGKGSLYINNQVAFVQVIRDSSLDLFNISKVKKLKFFEYNKEVLNQPVFKNLAILSICAAFGIRDNDFNKLIDMGCDVNIKDNNGMTPILWAAKHMSYDIVFTLLRHGANVGQRRWWWWKWNSTYKTLLSHADKSNHYIVLRLLRTSKDNYATDEYGKTLLWWAADKRFHDIVRALIERGTDTSGADARGNTLLHMVARAGHDQTVSQFILASADINIANSDGDTALIFAAECGHDKIVSELIAAKAEVNIANRRGNRTLIRTINSIYYEQTDLKCSADNGYDKIMSKLITAKADVNIPNSNGDTALTVAMYNRHDKIVSALIDAGANVNVAGSNGRLALINAIEFRHDKIASKLIGAGADLNMTTGNGDTALMRTALYGNNKIISELIGAGANVNTANSDGDTALILAASKGHDKITTQLAQAGANVNVTNNKGETALSIAASSGYHKVVTKLINLGAYVDTADKQGATPLLLATKHKHRKISMYLIEKGASVTAVDADGNTPLLFAAKHGDYELALELINRGARTDTSANNRGETPLSCAQQNKDDEMEHIITSKRRRLN